MTGELHRNLGFNGDIEEYNRALADMSTFLPECAASLPRNDFRNVVRTASAHEGWTNLDGKLFAGQFRGRFPGYPINSGYALGIAVVNRRQKSDIFVRDIDSDDGALIQPRVHGFLQFANYPEAIWRFRYGFRRPTLSDCAERKRCENGNGEWTDYFSFNPAGWGDDEARGLVCKHLVTGWETKLDNLDGILKNPVLAADAEYRPYGLCVRSWQNGEERDGIEVFPIDRDPRQSVAGSLPFIGSLLTQRPVGIYFPRTILLNSSTAKRT